MKSKTDLLFMLFSQPRQAMKLILDEPPLGFILIIFLLALANWHIAAAVSYQPGFHALAMYFTFGFFVKIVGILIALLVLVSLIHFLADLMGSTASAGGLYLLFMASLAPFILTSPAVLLSATAYTITFFFLLAWVLVIQVAAVQVLYRISSGQALFLYVLPYVLFIALVPLYLVINLVVTLVTLI
ncbi:YIP1 family protein [bacterium]|nr:YIP1 family protein [bacterium]